MKWKINPFTGREDFKGDEGLWQKLFYAIAPKSISDKVLVGTTSSSGDSILQVKGSQYMAPVSAAGMSNDALTTTGGGTLGGVSVPGIYSNYSILYYRNANKMLNIGAPLMGMAYLRPAATLYHDCRVHRNITLTGMENDVEIVLMNLTYNEAGLITVVHEDNTPYKLKLWGSPYSQKDYPFATRYGQTIPLSELGPNSYDIIRWNYNGMNGCVAEVERVSSDGPVSETRTITMSDSEIDTNRADDFERTCGADEQFTVTNPILKKPFRMKLTGGTLNATLFSGYAENWINGSAKTDYDPGSDNWLYCEIRSAGEIYLFFES